VRKRGVLSPRQEMSFTFRGVRFYTRNLGATDSMNGRFVWFAAGCWAHDQADGVFSSVDAAVADRFNLWEHLGLSYAPKFREPDQLKALEDLRSEIARSMRASRKKAAA